MSIRPICNAIGFAIAYTFVLSRFSNTNEVQYAVQPVYLQPAFSNYPCVDLSARWDHLVIPNNWHFELLVNRGAAVGDFLLMSIASMPLWLMIAIPISGFIAVNWVFNRILADRELLVMQSIGLSPLQLAKAPIALGVMLTAFLVFNSVYLLPTSFGAYKDLQFKLRNGIPTILLGRVFSSRSLMT